MPRAALHFVALLAVSASLAALGCAGSLVVDPGSDGPGSTGPDSVGDVTVPGSGGGSQPPLVDTLRARVRNESDSRADVTIRFLRDGVVVHLAFVRVPAETSTTVVTAESAEEVELFGVDGRGRVLPAALYVYGVDFDGTKPAEYVVEGLRPADPEPETPVPDPVGPISLSMLEPVEDVSLRAGSLLLIRWDDANASASATVQIRLEADSATASARVVPLGPAIGAALDGLNDQLMAVVQDVPEGTYRVVGRLDDGNRSVSAAAPGLVRVIPSPMNEAPSIRIKEVTAGDDGVRNGDAITVSWEDADADDNATVTFRLEAPSAAGIARAFSVGPPIAEDPDGPTADSARLVLIDVLPGLYDLVAAIDDGELAGEDRAERVVRVLPARDNEAPQLLLLEPQSDLVLEAGMGFLARWVDADANDNARISLHLDSGLNGAGLGSEVLVMQEGISEDPDGADDQRYLTIPHGTRPGVYRLAGIIEDGAVEVVTHAPGLIRVEVPVVVTPPEDPPDVDPDPGPEPGPGPDPDPGPDPEPDPELPFAIVPMTLSPGVGAADSAELAVEVVQAPAPRIDASRVRLTNTAYGGEVAVAIVAVSWRIAPDGSLIVAVPLAEMPRDARPSEFDVTIDFADGGLVVSTLQSQDPVDLAALDLRSVTPTAPN